MERGGEWGREREGGGGEKQTERERGWQPNKRVKKTEG